MSNQWNKTMVKKLGSEEAVSEFMAGIGKKGGKMHDPNKSRDTLLKRNPNHFHEAGKLGGKGTWKKYRKEFDDIFVDVDSGPIELPEPMLKRITRRFR